ncbi:hypothetical protein H2200_005851 [Cladophialophora chaetospira]|uniref:Uncharacterized protein n=1 Tax=Cladophialophora chaetospira TaxID=386627 RepID=A0AA39CIJ9_9EURO|nr:hypothetical protein H2200_005851 [Cladophialophora chaetospira]
MSTADPQPPQCVGHNYVTIDLIPMDLNMTTSLLQDAIAEIRKMIANLKSHDRLEADESGSEPPSKKRKAKKGKQSIGIREQVSEVLNKITHTEDWSGQRSIQSLIREHGKEWARKWGHPNGVMHDMLRVYPECRYEITRDRSKHDTVFNSIDTFRSVSSTLRNEGQKAATRQAAKEAEKTAKAKNPS